MREKLKNWIIFAIVVSAASAAIYNYFFLVDKPSQFARIDQHNLIIHGTAESPYRYRILIPFIVETAIKMSSLILPYPKAFLIMYAFAEMVSITFLLWMLFVYCRLWFTREQALIGVLFVSSTLVMALRDHEFQPWSLLEPGLFTLGLLWIYRKKNIAFTCLIFVATLNRETALFLPIAFLCTEIDLSKSNNKKEILSQKSIILFLGWMLLWGVTYVGLRVIRGNVPQVLTLHETWELNTLLHSLVRTVVEGSLFLGFFWLFAMVGYKYADEFMKKTAWVVPLYLIPIILWGSWHEVRLLMPMYPILIPLGLSYLYKNNNLAN